MIADDTGFEAPRDQDDYIDGASSTALRGLTIEYDYSRGTRYRLAFDHDSTVHVTVVGHAGSESSRPSTPPPLTYRARQLRPGMILVHWLVKPAPIHVTLVFDFESRMVHVAAMMPPNRWEFFDTGRIVSVRPGSATPVIPASPATPARSDSDH